MDGYGWSGWSGIATAKAGDIRDGLGRTKRRRGGLDSRICGKKAGVKLASQLESLPSDLAVQIITMPQHPGESRRYPAVS
jgi:hypothetical protein